MRRIAAALVVAFVTLPLFAQPYDIGSPTTTNLFVDPVNGSDSNSGATRATAMRTLDAAWRTIPIRTTLTTGYRIQLMAGTHPRTSIPNYFESRWGTAQFPVIIQAADASRSARVEGDFNMFDVRYLYVIGLDMQPQPPGDVIHCELCDHLLIRDTNLDGGQRQAQETLKVNQSSYVFVEGSDIHGAYDNAIDFVSVQRGHVINNRISNADDWCIYAKGGSAYLTVEGNEIYQCGTGGFTAGQGTGFQYMTSPWLQYEAYDIKVLNNVIHDTEGAGLGVNGGYNILMAHNTMVRTGTRSHLFEAVYGARSCDGQPGDAGRERCGQYLAAGGWGNTDIADGENFVRIPNRNVFLYNNVFYNPPGVVSAQHFTIAPPSVQSATPTEVRADVNLQIRGNVIFNPTGTIGIEGEFGCGDSHPTCNRAQIAAENTINTIDPQLDSSYRPTAGSPLLTARTFAIPAFNWSDLPSSVPTGTLTNSVARDRAGNARSSPSVAGAYVGGGGTTPIPTEPARRRPARQ